MFLWDKMINRLQQKFGVNKFLNIEFRSKHHGWGDFVIKTFASDGRVHVTSPLKNEFYDLFFCNQLLNDSCSDCALRSTLGYTDIRLGDFWGTEYRKNERGVSGVTLVTEHAKMTFDMIIPLIEYEQKDLNVFLSYQSWNHTYSINQQLREKMLKVLRDKDSVIEDVAKVLYKTRTMLDGIKVIIKQIVFALPTKIAVRFRR
jgi:hypothetical protein